MNDTAFSWLVITVWVMGWVVVGLGVGIWLGRRRR